MNTSVAITFALIVIARITDVTLDTLRTAAIVQGRRVFAATLGFFEAVIYVTAIAKVLLNMDHPIYALAYGLGYALGTYLGITIERRLAFGLQVASLFTRKGAELAKALILAGYRVARVEGHSREGEVTILYVEMPRKQAPKLIHDAGRIDETCFCVINDVRSAGFAARRVNLNVIGQKQPGFRNDLVEQKALERT
jgi:uncharacterized protein YebE (UPF0316 family)